MSELKKILWAEDEPDIRTIVEISMQTTSSFETKFVENGKILLDVVDDYKPDLIMLDSMMPEMDGITTLQKLREAETTRNIPVIFMTAKAQFVEVQKYENLNILGVIAKPFDPLSLAEEITKLWNSKN